MEGEEVHSSGDCCHNIKRICFYDPDHLTSCRCNNEENFPKHCPVKKKQKEDKQHGRQNVH